MSDESKGAGKVFIGKTFVADVQYEFSMISTYNHAGIEQKDVLLKTRCSQERAVSRRRSASRQM